MQIIDKYAKMYRVDRELITAIMDHESAFDPSALNPSDPSYGLMQIMVPTAKQFGYTGKDGSGLFDPETNISIGTQYIRSLMNQYSDIRDVISGYNAGPGGVKHPYINPGYVGKVFSKYTLLRIIGDLNKLIPFAIPIGILAGFLLIPQDKK